MATTKSTVDVCDEVGEIMLFHFVGVLHFRASCMLPKLYDELRVACTRDIQYGCIFSSVRNLLRNDKSLVNNYTNRGGVLVM